VKNNEQTILDAFNILPGERGRLSGWMEKGITDSIAALDAKDEQVKALVEAAREAEDCLSVDMAFGEIPINPKRARMVLAKALKPSPLDSANTKESEH
jgi:hypothetical protein